MIPQNARLGMLLDAARSGITDDTIRAIFNCDDPLETITQFSKDMRAAGSASASAYNALEQWMIELRANACPVLLPAMPRMEPAAIDDRHALDALRLATQTAYFEWLHCCMVSLNEENSNRHRLWFGRQLAQQIQQTTAELLDASAAADLHRIAVDCATRSAALMRRNPMRAEAQIDAALSADLARIEVAVAPFVLHARQVGDGHV